MVDTLTPSERSRRMSLIRSSDTVPEIAIRKAIHSRGLRFRLGVRTLPGKPDLVFPRHKAVLFVHGCFWHRHQGCKIATTPKSNTSAWVEKFDKNVARDARVCRQLGEMGWRVFIVWECELSNSAKIEDVASRLAINIRGF
jgi:DNA mismatch endonuclease (patch repair protein)